MTRKLLVPNTVDGILLMISLLCTVVVLTGAIEFLSMIWGAQAGLVADGLIALSIALAVGSCLGWGCRTWGRLAGLTLATLLFASGWLHLPSWFNGEPLTLNWLDQHRGIDLSNHPILILTIVALVGSWILVGGTRFLTRWIRTYLTNMSPTGIRMLLVGLILSAALATNLYKAFLAGGDQLPLQMMGLPFINSSTLPPGLGLFFALVVLPSLVMSRDCRWYWRAATFLPGIAAILLLQFNLLPVETKPRHWVELALLSVPALMFLATCYCLPSPTPPTKEPPLRSTQRSPSIWGWLLVLPWTLLMILTPLKFDVAYLPVVNGPRVMDSKLVARWLEESQIAAKLRDTSHGTITMQQGYLNADFSRSSQPGNLDSIGDLISQTRFIALNGLTPDIDLEPISKAGVRITVQNSVINGDQLAHLLKGGNPPFFSNCEFLQPEKTIAVRPSNSIHVHQSPLQPQQFDKPLQLEAFLNVEDLSGVRSFSIHKDRFSLQEWEQIVELSFRCPVNIPIRRHFPAEHFDKIGELNMAMPALMVQGAGPDQWQWMDRLGGKMTLSYDLISQPESMDWMFAFPRQLSIQVAAGSGTFSAASERMAECEDDPVKFEQLLRREHFAFPSEPEIPSEAAIQSLWFPTTDRLGQLKQLPHQLSTLSLDPTWIEDPDRATNDWLIGNVQSTPLSALTGQTQLQRLYLGPLIDVVPAALVDQTKLRVLSGCSPLLQPGETGFDQFPALEDLTLYGIPEPKIITQLQTVQTLQKLTIVNDWSLGPVPGGDAIVAEWRAQLPGVEVQFFEKGADHTEIPEAFKAHLKRLKPILREKIRPATESSTQPQNVDSATQQ